MTDQPENWERVNLKSAVIFGRNRGEDYSEARFSGPDREANARLFIRAQMMDELAEAAKQTRLAIDTLQSQVNDTGEYDEHAALGLFYGHEILGTILAKIEGEK